MPKNKQKTMNRPLYKTPIFYTLLIIITGAITFFAVKALKNEPSVTSNISSQSYATTNLSANSDTNSESPKTSTKNESSSETNSISDDQNSSSDSPDGKTPEKFDSSNNSANESITGSLTTARFINEKLVIRVSIDQYLYTGTCELVLTDGSPNAISKTANIIPSAATSTCEGFDIDLSELESMSRSQLSININLISGSQSGTITGRVD